MPGGAGSYRIRYCCCGLTGLAFWPRVRTERGRCQARGKPVAAGILPPLSETVEDCQSMMDRSKRQTTESLVKARRGKCPHFTPDYRLGHEPRLARFIAGNDEDATDRRKPRRRFRSRPATANQLQKRRHYATCCCE